MDLGLVLRRPIETARLIGHNKEQYWSPEGDFETGKYARRGKRRQSVRSQLTRCKAAGHVMLTDHCVEFFPLLKRCEKRERFSVGCYRSG